MTEKKEPISDVKSDERKYSKMSPERRIQKLVKEYFHIRKLIREKEASERKDPKKKTGKFWQKIFPSEAVLVLDKDLKKKYEEIMQEDDEILWTVIRSKDTHPVCSTFLPKVIVHKEQLEKEKKEKARLQAIVDKDPEIIKQRREQDARSPEEKARIPDTFYAWGFFMGGGSDLCIRTKGVWFHGEPTLWHYSKFQ